ncbi:class I SAM-dependent methyltransferase [Phreatobacter stygius]|uniref:class I SAM-dependent methyltransferase n=1 Tax=Phreatobacter stygius TaxID=1940610 RepID=UPI001476CEE1|nr:methyltransferase domain-containing protein [Phreatobacter stygius]
MPQRLTFAVERLAIQPADRLLEIGCGRGLAVALACERLGEAGSILAIDRSAAMIEAARLRNRGHVASGKARFQAVSLADAAFAGARFDTVFAVNVNLFWIEAARALAIVRRILAPGGRLHLVYEPPSAAQLSAIVDKLTASLESNGFALQASEGKAGMPLIGVTARAVLSPEGVASHR